MKILYVSEVLLKAGVALGAFLPLLFPGLAYSQGALGNTSTINVKGNSNIITVYQNGKPVKYDMQIEQQAQEFLHYLKTIPSLSKDVKKLLKYDEKILELVTRISDLINEQGFLSIDRLIDKIEKYAVENERLKNENSRLRDQARDPEFLEALKLANDKLEQFDNEGYRQILETFKILGKSKIARAKGEIAQASYLQAKNSFINFKFEVALQEINEALEIDLQNGGFWYLKAEIATELFKLNDAIYAYGKALEYQKDEVQVALIYTNLSVVYQTFGQYNNAIEYAKKILALKENDCEINEQIIGSAYSNLGSASMALGDYDSAILHYQKAFAFAEQEPNNGSLNVAKAHNNLGAAYCNKKDYNRAILHTKEALKIHKSILGNAHPSTAVNYNNLGAIYHKIGDYNLAIANYTAALKIDMAIFGEEHPNTAIDLNNLGEAYKDIGDIKKAIELQEKALNIEETILGKDHPSSAVNLDNLATTYAEIGNREKALELYNSALQIRINTFGEFHLNTAVSYDIIGTFFIKQGDWPAAIRYFQKSVVLFEKKTTEHPDKLAIAYSNLGAAYSENRTYDSADYYFSKSVSVIEKISQHSTKLRYVYSIICNSLICRGDLEKAVNMISKTTISHLSSINKAKFLNGQGIEKAQKNNFLVAANFFQIGLRFLITGKVDSSEVIWPVLYCNLAKMQCKLGDEESSEMFDTALQLCNDKKSSEAQQLKEEIEAAIEKCKAN